MRSVACIIALGLSTAGCGSGGRHTTLSEGTACLVEVDGGAATEVQVMFDGCEPCGTLEDVGCVVVLDGNLITVTASATFDASGDEPCTAICRNVDATARCDVPTLEDGTYELQFGGKSVSAKVPVGDVPACAGNHRQ